MEFYGVPSVTAVSRTRHLVLYAHTILIFDQLLITVALTRWFQ